MHSRYIQRHFQYLLIAIGFLAFVEFKVINTLESDSPNIVVILTDDQDLTLNGMASIFGIS